MAIRFRGPVDPIMQALASALRPYADRHPASEAEVVRYSPVSVRVRIIDPGFQGKNRSERHRLIWPLLHQLDADILGELTMLLLITPQEKPSSFVNRDFEGPTFAECYPDLSKPVRESGTATL
jgi:stress-induced morphogen